MSSNLWTAFIAANGTNQILVQSYDGHTFSGSRFINQWSPFTPALAFFKGRLYVAFITDDASGRTHIPSDRIFVCSTSDGITWSPAVFINQHSKCAPALAVWGDELCLAFISNDSTNRIMTSTYTERHGWAATATDTGQKSAQPPSLAQFGADLYLAFVSDDGRNELLYSSLAPFSHNHWGTATDTGTPCGYSPSLAASSQAPFSNNLWAGFIDSVVGSSAYHSVIIFSPTPTPGGTGGSNFNQFSSAAPSLAWFENSLYVGFIADNTSRECLLLPVAFDPTNGFPLSQPIQNIDTGQQSNAGISLAVAHFACGLSTP